MFEVIKKDKQIPSVPVKTDPWEAIDCSIVMFIKYGINCDKDRIDDYWTARGGLGERALKMMEDGTGENHEIQM